MILRLFFFLCTFASIRECVHASQPGIDVVDGTVAFAVESDPPHAIYASANGDTPSPMQSVFKFPLALAILHEVDQGKWTLDHKITVEKKDLLPDTWSPLRDRNPNGGIFTLAELLSATVAESDNNTCDILISLLGGTKKLNSYIQDHLGVKEINIVYNEKEMHENTTRQYANSSTPNAMNELLKRFAEGKILSAKTTKFLMDVMLETKTGTGRIKGNLPKGIPVAHKTGSSGIDEAGMNAATNDVGIIFMSGKKRIFISVFMSDCKGDPSKIEKTIADIAAHYYDQSISKQTDAN